MISRTKWLDQRSTETLFECPIGIRYLMETLPLHAEVLEDTLDARIAAYVWWKLQGQYVYQSLEWGLTQEEFDYLRNNALNRSLLRVIPIWLQSDKELGLMVSETLIQQLMQPEQVNQEDETCILPNFITRIYEDRPDLQKMFNLDAMFHYWGLLIWWDRYGQFEYPRLKWSTQTNVLQPLLAPVKFASEYEFPKFLHVIINLRPDIKARYFEEKGAIDVEGLIEWWHDKGKQDHPFFENVILHQVAPSVYHAAVKAVNGVNVVGFAQGVLGLGEDARLIGDVCLQNNIPVAMVNAPIVGPEKVIELRPELELSHYPKYNTTIFCLPPTEMMRLSLEKGRSFIEHQSYNIGACPWELPNWPITFAQVREFVDEFWAQSEFVKNCLTKNGDTPAYKMPMAVTLPKPTENVRARFGLPKESYLFYLMFDGNSWLTRKNPLAGVQAFQKAFPKSHADNRVGLVIKAMNINFSDQNWQKIEKIAVADERITIITDKLNRQDVVNLMSSCDSYISLHRSEGFGRVLAEAMLLNQPVITTNFSGNVDFCKTDTAFLVDGELVPLKPKDYLFSDGQYWCDPDIDIAASQILRVYQNKSLREKISQNGAVFVQEHYSIETVARLQKQRLNAIWKS